MRKILLRVIIFCLFVISITSTAVYSHPAIVGPDDPDYIANVIEEALQVGEVQNPAQRILLLQQMANRRIEEIELMAAKNKPEYIPGLVKAYKVIVQNIEDSIDQVTTEVGLSKALEAVSNATAKHTEVLKSVLSKVPDQAKLAIEHAIEVSKTGGNTALDRLTKIQEGKVSRGRPEEVGKLEKLGKPEGVGRLKGTNRPSDKGKP